MGSSGRRPGLEEGFGGLSTDGGAVGRSEGHEEHVKYPCPDSKVLLGSSERPQRGPERGRLKGGLLTVLSMSSNSGNGAGIIGREVGRPVL